MAPFEKEFEIISAKNKKLDTILQSINDPHSYYQAHLERKFLSRWGGGCALDIGVTVENFLDQQILFARGKDEHTKKYFHERKYLSKSKTKKVKHIFPANLKTYKMFNGHRGINHPVLNINTGKGEITSQNHGFAEDYDTAVANKSVKISHKHLNDQTVAGLEIKSKNCFSVQYHPEAGPGPNDGNYLFDQFLSKLN